MYFFVCYDPDEIQDFSSESVRLDALVDGLSRSLGVSADSCRVSKAVSYSRAGALAVPDGVSSFNALRLDFD
jgi:hypothetical protein